MRHIPAIKTVMTPFPYSVGLATPLEDARAFLQRHDIHHLPVTDAERLVGIVTDRDIRLYLERQPGGNAGAVTVGDICSGNPCIVDLNERLDTVLQMMAARHLDCVLVTRNDRLAGVFTGTDVCRSFAAWLEEQFRPPGGDSAA